MQYAHLISVRTFLLEIILVDSYFPIPLKSIPPAKKKMPSRYHRRRPKNLLDEYTRRKRNIRWLETHIWHAKRCVDGTFDILPDMIEMFPSTLYVSRYHMTERWGYKLPLCPTDKGLRAGFRAATKFCMLQDHSYKHCLEILGPRERVVTTLQKTLPRTSWQDTQ